MEVNKSVESENNSINTRRDSQRGFTMLEMIVAIVIFLIITASIFGLLQVGRIDRNRSSRRSDMMKNARTAIHLIGRDALNAGLGYNKAGTKVPDGFLANRFSLPADTDLLRDNLSSVIAGNNLFDNDIQEDPTVKTDEIVFAYRDVDFNGGNAIIVGEPIAGGSSDTARVQTVTAGDAAAVNRYDLYMIETGNSQVVVMATDKVDNSTVDFAPTDPLGLNQAFDGAGSGASLLRPCSVAITSDCSTFNGAATRINMKRVLLVAYKVKQDGTLVRLTYGNNTSKPADEQIQEQPIAYGIKDMQFRYVLNDGKVMDNPTAGDDGILGSADDNPSNNNKVAQVTVTLKVASTEIDEQTGQPAVITLTATFSTRNIQYDA
ncbi:MAG: PulJ/GspJ family protein [Pyrinomonadaceae bacterium]